jgi:hypothetical protein
MRNKTRTPLVDRHPLTADAKPLFEAGRLSYSAGYLKPTKRLLVDLAVRIQTFDQRIKSWSLGCVTHYNANQIPLKAATYKP